MTYSAPTTSTHASQTGVNRLSNTLLLNNCITAYSSILSILFLAYLLYYANYGFDFTDEGFYLAWISKPYEYSSSITQFGYIYHPLYLLIHGNISLLRQLNICLTLLLSTLFVYSYINNTVTLHAKKQILLIISSSIATSSCMIFRFWLTTPNYNTLTLQGLLVTAIGLLLTESRQNKYQIIGIVLTGVGGWLTLMAKPSSAALLAIAATLFIVSSRFHILKKLFLSSSIALLLTFISALAIDGSIATYLHRIINGMHYVNILGSGHSLLQAFRIDHFELTNSLRNWIIILTSYIFISIMGLSSKHKLIQHISLISILFLPALSMASLINITKDASSAPFGHSIILAIPTAWLIISLLTIGPHQMAERFKINYSVLILILIMPSIYSFGTNTNYWITSFAAAIFWLAIPLVFITCCPKNSLTRFLMLFGISCQSLTFALVHVSLEAPYRQDQALHKNNVITKIGTQKTTLLLSEAYSKYITEAQHVGNEVGFKSNTGIIDLTGQSPGLLYALGAVNVGQPWLLGSYPGSDDYAAESLGKVSCNSLALSWILVEPDGPRKLSTNILDIFGANIRTDYVEVGSWQTAPASGGYKEARKQILYKPIRSPEEAIKICETRKRNT